MNHCRDSAFRIVDALYAVTVTTRRFRRFEATRCGSGNHAGDAVWQAIRDWTGNGSDNYHRPDTMRCKSAGVAREYWPDSDISSLIRSTAALARKYRLQCRTSRVETHVRSYHSAKPRECPQACDAVFSDPISAKIHSPAAFEFEKEAWLSSGDAGVGFSGQVATAVPMSAPRRTTSGMCRPAQCGAASLPRRCRRTRMSGDEVRARLPG